SHLAGHGRHHLHLFVVQPDCCRQLTRLSNCEIPPAKILWKTSPVRSDCSTGVDAILKQVHEQCWAREKVVHKDMVVFSHKRPCQGLHHRPPKTKLR
ncbi:hypothetical protein GBAR_LOCUS4135, partial [Geodia barretti]